MLFFRVMFAILIVAMAAPIVILMVSVSPFDVMRALGSDGTHNALNTTIIASLLAVTAATLLGVPTGFALARTSRSLRTAALFVLALPLAFPPVASGIVLLHAVGSASPIGVALARFGWRLVDTLGGVALAEFYVSASFVAVASAAAFGTIDPKLEESAATLGATRWTIFRRIALPLALPGIIAGILLAWLRSLGEYGATSIVAYHPESLSIHLSVVLAADGIRAALPLTYAFALLAALIVGAQWAIRGRVP